MGDLAGQPNYFVQKIWRGLITESDFDYCDMYDFEMDHLKIFARYWDGHMNKPIPKLHTIRHDPKNRWKAGNKIHFVINNRTKNRFQFAPVIECSATQDFEIKEWVMTSKPAIKLADGRVFTVRIDGGYLFYDELEQVAMSDGFPSVEHFFKWFGADTLPDTKIIHWTEMQY